MAPGGTWNVSMTPLTWRAGRGHRWTVSRRERPGLHSERSHIPLAISWDVIERGVASGGGIAHSPRTNVWKPACCASVGRWTLAEAEFAVSEPACELAVPFPLGCRGTLACSARHTSARPKTRADPRNCSHRSAHVPPTGQAPAPVPRD